MDPVWIIALATLAAALSAALGVGPSWREPRVPGGQLGWANASAAGLMLGAAFVLAEEGLALSPWAGMAGAVAGVVAVLSSHALLDAGELEPAHRGSADAASGLRALAMQTIHGALEGVAVGVGAVLDLKLGLFLALAFAVHNVAEGTVLCAILRRTGVSPSKAAGLAAGSNAGQVVLAVATYALVRASPGLAAGALGVATGALVYLVMVELLPDAYEQRGEASIAVVTSLVMGVILLLRGAVLP